MTAQLSAYSLRELHSRANVYTPTEIKEPNKRGETLPSNPRQETSFAGICLSRTQVDSRAFLNGAQVRTYIKCVIEDLKFQLEPKKYVADWEMRRTEERSQGEERFPQHLALDFFIKNRDLL